MALIVGSAVSSFCLVWVVFYQLTSLTGALGFLVCWYLSFLGLTWFGTSQVIERQVATDRVAGILVWSAGLLIIGIVVFIVAWVTFKAVPSIHWAHSSPRTRRPSPPPTPTSSITSASSRPSSAHSSRC